MAFAAIAHAQASADIIAPAPAAAQAEPVVSTPNDGIGKIAPIVPPVTPEQSVMSVECEVPRGRLADQAPLPRLAKRLRKNKKPVVLAVGSSSTWGVGASRRTKAYPAQLEQLLEKAWVGANVEVINRGVSGEIASKTAERLLILAGETRPDLVLWQLGTNDAVMRVRVDGFESTVRNTVGILRATGIDVVLVGLQYTPKWAHDGHYFAIRNVLRKIARDEKLLYVRRFTAMEFIANKKTNLQMMAQDNFHLNDLGYQCMAEHVAQAVIANLFIRRPEQSAPGN